MSISLCSGEIYNSSKMEIWARVLSSWLTRLYLEKEELVATPSRFVTGPGKITLEACPQVTMFEDFFVFIFDYNDIHDVV